MSEGSDLAETLIRQLNLAPHPEGGFFRRIHESPGHVATPFGDRFQVTSIYYLLTRAQPLGRLHRNRSAILHFLLEGGPVDYRLAASAASIETFAMSRSQRFLQVAGGCWKGARLAPDADFALIAEVVTPGFDYADHEFATEEVLRRERPSDWMDLRPYLAP